MLSISLYGCPANHSPPLHLCSRWRGGCGLSWSSSSMTSTILEMCVCVCVRTRWMCVIVGGTRRNTCTAVDHCIPYSVFFSSHVKYHFAKFAPLKSRPPVDKMGRNIKHIPRNGAMGFVRGLYNVHPMKKNAIRYICIKKSLMYVCMYVHVYTCVVGGGPEC